MADSKQSTCITRQEAKISADELMIFTLTVAVIQLMVCAIPHSRQTNASKPSAGY